MRYPTDNHRATSRFGRRTLGQSMDPWHSGQDYGCLDPNNPTNDPIYCIAPGIVRRVNNDKNGYGNYCVVEHGDYCTLYAHLHRVNVVEGQSVNEGHLLGLMGKTGGTNTIHLHFEVRDVPYKDFWIRWNAIAYNGDREPYYAIDPDFFFYKHMNYDTINTEDKLTKEVVRLTERLNEIYK